MLSFCALSMSGGGLLWQWIRWRRAAAATAAGDVDRNPLFTDQGFALATLRTRFPAIIGRVIQHNDDVLTDERKQELAELSKQVQVGAPLPAIGHEDDALPVGGDAVRRFALETVHGRYAKAGWLAMPWFACETYLYRCILHSFGYFDGEARSFGVDPWRGEKQTEMDSERARALVDAALAVSSEAQPLRLLMRFALWGNRADLSYTKVSDTVSSSSTSDESLLLCDDSGDVRRFFLRRRRRCGTIGYIADNSGTELLLDLVLIDYLLSSNTAERVVLHVKAYPTYVSDATAADVDAHIDALLRRATSDAQRQLGARLRLCCNAGRLAVRGHWFWNSALFFDVFGPASLRRYPALSRHKWIRDSIEELRHELAQHTIVFVKGDANYRRMLNDSLDWPPTTPFATVVSRFFPGPVCCLRTLKSDPCVGLASGVAEELDGVDPAWRFNGKRGVIQAALV